VFFIIFSYSFSFTSPGSPKINKLKELKSNFSIAHKGGKKASKEETKEEEIVYNNTDVDVAWTSQVKKEIESELKGKFNPNQQSKYQKSLDMASTIHGGEFYSKNLKSKYYTNYF